MDQLLEKGEELGDIMDKIAGLKDVKKGPGTLGILTKGLVTRQGEFESGVACALAPWIGSKYYG